MLLAWGRSHRTTTDGELIRWGRELARVEARSAGRTRRPRPATRSRSPSSGPARGGARKRIRVNGVPRRAAGLLGLLRTVVFAPEEMLLVAGLAVPAARGARPAGRRAIARVRPASCRLRPGPPAAQRPAAADPRGAGDPRRAPVLGRAAACDAGASSARSASGCSTPLAGPLAAAHAEIAPDEAAGGRLALAYATNAPQQPGETIRDALARRLAETAEKEVWNGSTLVGPHRDDLVFELGGRDLATFASRGQQRTAILAFKLAELDLLTALDGHPPLLLLDDVFSELDPERRSHLVRRIAALPQAFVTTTTLDDLDPALRSVGTAWAVTAAEDGTARLERG